MKTDHESPLEHSSSPDGCREDCPACEDERLHARWEIDFDGGRIYIVDPSGTIALVGPCDTPDNEDHVNARLIAAAPELLAACKAVRDGFEKNLTEPMRLINEAIDAAEGTP